MNELKPEDVMDNHTKEKVICPWCKEEMRPYPHQGYYWFECKCGARTPKLWHATQEQTREKALSYAALLREKDAEIDRLYRTMDMMILESKEKDAEIERLQEDLHIWKDIAHRETGYVEKARAEAITEFAEKAKRRLPIVSPSVFDQIAKGMKGEQQ